MNDEEIKAWAELLGVNMESTGLEFVGNFWKEKPHRLLFVRATHKIREQLADAHGKLGILDRLVSKIIEAEALSGPEE